MHFRRKMIKIQLLTQHSKKLFSATMFTLKLKEHNINTQKNETQGTLCKIDQIIRKSKLLRIKLSAKKQICPPFI